MVRAFFILILLSISASSFAQKGTLNKLEKDKSFFGVKLGTHRCEIRNLQFEWNVNSIITYDQVKIKPLFKKIKPIKVTYGFIDDTLWSMAIKVREKDFQPIYNKLIELYGEPQWLTAGGECQMEYFWYKAWVINGIGLSISPTPLDEANVRTFNFGMNSEEAYERYLHRKDLEQYYREQERKKLESKKD